MTFLDNLLNFNEVIMKKFIAMFAFLLIFSGFQNPVNADELHGRGKVFMEAIKKLDLSAAQKRQIALILKDHRAELKELTTGIKSSRKNLMDTIQSGNSSEHQIRTAFREMASYGEELAVVRSQIRGEVNAVLTPEQKVKAKAIRKEFASKMSERVALMGDRMDNWIDQNAQ